MTLSLSGLQSFRAPFCIKILSYPSLLAHFYQPIYRLRYLATPPQLYTHRTHPYRPHAFWLRVYRTSIGYMPTHHMPFLATHLSGQAHQPHPF
jgi:hypothetical protein